MTATAIRFAQILLDDCPRWALIGDERARLLPDDIGLAAFLQDPAQAATLAARRSITGFRYLPPLAPGARLFCVGRNYPGHASEVRASAPSHPSIFMRDRSSLVGHREPLVSPAVSSTYDFEGEVAVVLARGGRHLQGSEAASAIGGYTLTMDGSARDLQQHSLFAGKNLDRSGSLGPWIVPGALDDIERLVVETRVNGERMQHGRLTELIFPAEDLVVYLSRILELRAGDIISTGTPAGVGMGRTPPRWLLPGDEVEVSVGPIDRLVNSVFSECRQS